MQIAFRGSRLKVKRAYKHIEELEAWLRDLVQSNINTAMSYKDQNPGSESYAVLVQRPVGFSEDVAPIVGDAVHNLRATLDFVATAIVIAGRKDDPTLAYFPLYDTRQSLINSPEYGFIERVAPDLALEIADVIKPYKIGGDSRFWERREPRTGTRAYIHNQRYGYPSVEIKFGNGEAFEDKPIIPTLRELAELVGDTIDKLEARCK